MTRNAKLRRALLEDLSEDEFQQHIIKLAKEVWGWRCFHARPARTLTGWRTAITGDKGFPDLVLARDGDLLLWEVKSKNGSLTADQKAWIEALRCPGTQRDVRVVRPRDVDVIEAILRDGVPT